MSKARGWLPQLQAQRTKGQHEYKPKQYDLFTQWQETAARQAETFFCPPASE